MVSKKSNFGTALFEQLQAREMTQSDLAKQIGTSAAYVSSLTTGSKSVSPERVESISTTLNLAPQERISLHRAAATDLGFKLDLPDDF